MWCKNVLFVLLLTLGSSWAEQPKNSGDKSDYKRKDCEHLYSTTCLKLDIVSWVDKLSENDSYNVIPGVTIVRENVSASDNMGNIVADLARSFPNDPDARLDAFLMRKVRGYLGSHSIKLNLFEDDAEDKDGVATGRRRRNKNNGLNSLLAAAALLKGTLFALALGGLAALAGKALITGLISLLLSGIIGLKSLTGGGGKTTYEVVSKPVYTHSASHSTSHEDYPPHSGWNGRSFELPLPLGLQPGYNPAH